MQPPVSFSLRQLDAHDLSAVLKVYQHCEDFLALGPTASASAEMVRQGMTLSAGIGGRFCGIFAADGTMIGIVDYILEGFEGDPGCAFLELLMIAREYRGQGLGAAVVRYVEAEIRRHPQVRAIRAGVQVNNPSAIRFWERQGYAIVSDAEDFPDGTTAFQLQKTLEDRV